MMVLAMCRWQVEWTDYGSKRIKRRAKRTNYARAKRCVFSIFRECVVEQNASVDPANSVTT